MSKISIKNLKIKEYKKVELLMFNFVKSNYKKNIEEIWMLQHYNVYTIGSSEKIKNKFINGIPIIKSSRGGKITFHGPGQQIIYFLLNIKRRKLIISNFIKLLKEIVIRSLNELNILCDINDMPGIYINGRKICSIGLRIKNGYSLHGLSLNVKMNMKYFKYIHPCGYKNLKMLQISDLIPNINIVNVRKILTRNILYFFKK
ncbi:MAG: lipoyl(octanoyl) transferase LipB [Enterobacteriaceae bacterium]